MNLSVMANVTESMMDVTTTTTESVYRTMNTTNYAYILYLRNNSPGVRKMHHYLTEMNTIKSSIFIAIAFIGLCLNFYFVGCIAFLKSLRQWRYMLIAWQALCDITGVCIIGGILQISLFIRNNDNINSWFFEQMGSARYIKFFYTQSCYLYEASRLLNEYSTGPVLTFLAVERLIVVVFPFRAKQLMNKWVYIGAAVGIPVFTLSMTMGVKREGNGGCGFRGIGGVYPDSKTKFIADLFLMFIIPAAACMVMYSFVVKKLMDSNKAKKKDEKKSEKSEKEKRNLLLSKCFFATTIAWIILWGWFYYWESQTVLEWRGSKEWTAGEYVLRDARDFGFYFYALVNPIIFITVNRQFQQPVKSLFTLMTKCCRK